MLSGAGGLAQRMKKELCTITKVTQPRPYYNTIAYDLNIKLTASACKTSSKNHLLAVQVLNVFFHLDLLTG